MKADKKHLFSRPIILICIISFTYLIVPSILMGGEGFKKYRDMAMRLQKQKKFKEADIVFSKGIQKYPNEIRLIYFRAKLRHHYLGSYQRAISDYTMVIKINPKFYPKSFWRRGDCYSRLGHHHLAIKDFSTCLKLMPNYDRVYMLRATAFSKMGMIDLAKKDLMVLIKHHPKFAKKAKKMYAAISIGKTI